MPADTANAYLRSQVMSASPAELRLMLLDGAIRFAVQGRQGLIDKNYEQSFEGISQCRAIVTELAVGVNRSVDPALCDRVTGVFMFIFRELTEANLEKDPDRLQKVIELLEYERETWRLAMEKMKQDRAKARAADPALGPAQAGTSLADRPTVGSLSVQA
ncbi:MAG: flagellar protein FliS [Phycisphaerales bacterium]|nr:MAG: flagellar protein FliS [Phycisphaerales bacterium]